MSKVIIPFNKPYFTGKETAYIKEAVESGKISGDGMFTKKVHDLFEAKYGFRKCLLTTSCTDALEMAAILINIQQGDEVIMPSYTFVSTANAFVLRGAKVIFCDSRKDHPGIDEEMIEGLITPRTKAIVAVHYAGVACDMAMIMALAEKYNIYVIEDAAQAINSYYMFPNGHVKPLGAIGHLAAFSFHETKNIISGEGGMLVINDDQFVERAEIIREKGTNRACFFRGEVDKYGWVDIGSSFLPSDIIAAFLFAQLEQLEVIQERRKDIWNIYRSELQSLQDEGNVQLPFIPAYATNNAHMFYLVCSSLDDRTAIIQALKAKGIMAVFHYLSLHDSEFFKLQHDKRNLANSNAYSDRLLRLPFYFELSDSTIREIAKIIYAVLEK
jgi:dTDP-4-amino-4,6-dideoxygalactose transaminase